jgi:hypothetical protein
VQEAMDQVAAYFPGLTQQDLTIRQPSGRDLKWRNTVLWARNTLADRGAIDRSIRGAWVITERGRQIVAQDEQEDTASVLPLLVSSPRLPAPRPSEIVVLGNPLYHRLRTTAQSGLDATAFEEALAEAFRVLGFDAVKIGGRGDTDIRVTAPLGKQQYIAIVEFMSPFGDMTLWNSLASCVVLPYISPYLRVTTLIV